MAQAPQLVFGPFRLDPYKKRLWRGKRAIALQPQPLAVLHYLLVHAGQVVPTAELLKEVWAGTSVTKTTLKVCVRAIRVALGDAVEAPRYLETAGHLGYRFLAPLTTTQPVASSQYPVVSRKTAGVRDQQAQASSQQLVTGNSYGSGTRDRTGTVARLAGPGAPGPAPSGVCDRRARNWQDDLGRRIPAESRV